LYQITSSITNYITFNNQHSLSLECNISTNNYTSPFLVSTSPFFCLTKSLSLFNGLCFCTCSLLLYCMVVVSVLCCVCSYVILLRGTHVSINLWSDSGWEIKSGHLPATRQCIMYVRSDRHDGHTYPVRWVSWFCVDVSN